MKPNADNLLKATQMASTMTPMSGTTGMMTTGAMRMGPALSGAMERQYDVEIDGKDYSFGFDNQPNPQAMQNLRDRLGITADPNNAEMALLEQAQMSTDPEEREGLMALIEKLQAQANAPMGEIAQELAAMGGGEDTALAHVRPGEVVVPPEIIEDPEVETLLESKFNEMGINPEEAVVGVGIASLNPNTGLEQFGFFKKIGKRIKKIAKKVAPVAGPLANFIPGVGPVLAGAIGAATNVAAGKGLKGALAGGLGGYGTGKFLGGIGGLKGGASMTQAGSTASQGGIRGLLGRAKEFILPGQDKVGLFGNVGKMLTGGQPTVQDIYAGGDPATQARIDRLLSEGASEAEILQNLSQSGMMPQRGGLGSFLSRKLLPQSMEDALQSRGGLGGLLAGGGSGGGFGGGFGDALKMGGIGALAAGLGKLAYDEAKDQKGVPLTPLTTMDATGRYNIEAEIARRMGQPAPNPVEFGLLPEGTLPELSGGKPRGMYGGGMVMPMAYAEGGNVAMEDFERMNGRIDGPGTETSDDIPAMLSDGEFVMTGRAVRGAGSFDMQNDGGIVTLTPNGSPDRESGTDLMYQLMEVFSGQARPSA